MSELIDRQALKDAVKRYAGEPIKEKDGKCQAICLDMLGVIDSQPIASPWHRVEERLPDDSRDVIIFTASGIVGIGSFIRPNWYQWYSGGGLPVDVTHWMEKPEPPKEDA